MKTFRLLLSLTLAAGLFSADAAEPKKMLVITQSKGFMHGSVKRPKAGELSSCEVALKQLGQQTGLFEATLSQDCAADFTKENLKN